MKIAILLTDINSTGGVAKTVCNLANSLSKKKYDVEIISCFKSEKKIRSYEIKDSIKVKYLNIDMDKNINKLKKQLYFIQEIKKSFIEGQYDIAIATNAHLNIYSVIATKKLKVKIIGSEHGAYNHLSLGWRMISKVFYRKLDKLVLLTTKEIDKYRMKKEKIEVIANMSFIEGTVKSSLNNKKISMINRIDENKNIINAIEAFSIVNKKQSYWTLNIYGDGDEEQVRKVRDKIKELDLENKVLLKGFSKDIERIYLNSDIVLMTSKSEGLPMVLIEAISYGVPVISYDINTGPSDIIIDSKNGFLVEPFNIKKISEKINYLIENKKALIKMGEDAIESSRIFKEDYIVNKWISLFENLVGGN